MIMWFSHVRLFITPWTVAYQAPPPMEFPRQEYWSGLSFPSPADLIDPVIKPRSPIFQADALLSESPDTSFNLLMWCITLKNWQISKHPCISMINITWSCCMILLVYCWFQFCSILLTIFASLLINDAGLDFLFVVSVWFSHHVDACLIECVQKCLCFALF